MVESQDGAENLQLGTGNKDRATRVDARGRGFRIRSMKPTTARMTRLLKSLGLTPSQHGTWCGFGLARWIKENPEWTERQWWELVNENLEVIHG